MSIQLHPKLGVNPKLTFCPRCGGESQELVLIGNRTSKIKCSNCGTMNFGARSSEKCGKCGIELYGGKSGTIGEHDRLPATEPCDTCKKEIAELRAIVAAGGIYWRCKDCPAQGVLKASPYTENVRRAMSIAAPDPCGVEFDHTNCPVCGPKEGA